MTLKQFIILVLYLLTIFYLYHKYDPDRRDYTGLTVKPYPDIAIDMEKEYKQDYIRLLWMQHYN